MLNIIYRMCENEVIENTRKGRPIWFCKKTCLKSFLLSANHCNDHIKSITFVHDGEVGELLTEIPISYNIDKIYYASNLQSLMRTFELADEMNGDIYFVEDDYLHSINSISQIAIAVKKLHLVNGYDHFDRYIRNDDIEYTKNIIFDVDSNIHWRIAESTCCTFAINGELYKNINATLKYFGLNDRDLFRYLHVNNIPLWTSIPGITTHLMDGLMSPGIDWEKFNYEIKTN